MKEIGSLPTFNPKDVQLDSNYLEKLTEDIYQVTVNEGIIIDIGWYPDMSSAGKFCCRVVINQDWSHPVVTFKTTDLNCVKNWLKGAITFWKVFSPEDYVP